MNIAKFPRIAFLENNLCDSSLSLLLNFFYLIPKRNSLLDKSPIFPFPTDLAFIMPIRCSEHTTQRETLFFSEYSLLPQYINISCLFVRKEKLIAFTCVNPLLFLLPFIIFILLLPFSMNFKSKFGLNLNTISLYS